jgi:outer membrane protein TolC
MSLCACFRPQPLSADRPLRLWSTQTLTLPQGKTKGKNKNLTTEQAIRLALRDNPALRVARAREEVARASVGEEVQLENPQLRIRNVELDGLAHGSPALDLALRVPIPRPWTLDARKQRAQLRLEEARARRSDLERRVRAKVRKLYARLAMMDLLAAQMEQTITLFDRYRKLAEQGVRDGAVTEVDASLPRLRYAETVDRRHVVRLRRLQVEGRLRQLVGAQPEQRITFQTGRADLGPGRRDLSLDRQLLTRRALTRRRDLRQAGAQVEIAQADAYIARAQRWPWLRFAEVSYNIRPQPDPLNFEFYLAIDLPLLSWNSGAIAAREARLKRRRLEERARVQEVVREVSDATAQVRETKARLFEAERSLLPALESSSRVVRQGVTHGGVDPLRATSVEWRRIRAYRRYLESKLAHREAIIDLEVAVGGEIGSQRALGKRSEHDR